MRYLVVLVLLSGCAGGDLLRALGLKICKNDSKLVVGKDVKLTTSKRDVENCEFIKTVEIKKCEGVASDRVDYTNQMLNRVGFFNGDTLLRESKDQITGGAYRCGE